MHHGGGNKDSSSFTHDMTLFVYVLFALRQENKPFFFCFEQLVDKVLNDK